MSRKWRFSDKKNHVGSNFFPRIFRIVFGVGALLNEYVFCFKIVWDLFFGGKTKFQLKLTSLNLKVLLQAVA